MASKVGAVTISQILKVFGKTAIILLVLSVSVLLTIGSFRATKWVVVERSDNICGKESKTSFCKNTKRRSNIWGIVISVLVAILSLVGLIALVWVFFFKTTKVVVESTFLPF